MSAWYVMSAIGFYPVNPCGGEYELGMPLFPEVTLHLENGNVFTITCHFSGEALNNTSQRSEESQKKNAPRVRFNGKRIKGTTISHKDIIEGGTLEFK